MVSSSVAQASHNRILSSLPEHDQLLVSQTVENVEFEPGELVCAAGKTIRHVVFPRAGVISLFKSSFGEPDVGVDVLDNAGMFGVAVAAGRTRSTIRAVAQGRASADRIEAKGFAHLLSQSLALRYAVLQYGVGLSERLAQNIVCRSAHAAPQRLARWMLDITAGHASPGRFASTQAEAALALGVQRPAISRAASALQTQGLIRYQRGEVVILDRTGLRKVACRCSRASSASSKR